MKTDQLDPTYIGEKKTYLLEVLGNMEEKDFQKNMPDGEISQTYLVSGTSGKAIYQSFTDDELTEYLRQLALRLGHAPSQKEVFWIIKDYLKMRFQKWPYALKAAGLSTSAGAGGKSIEQMAKEEIARQELLDQVRKKAAELGKIPHPKDLPQTREKLRKYYDSWGDVIAAADIDRSFFEQTVEVIPDLELEYITMLEAVKEYAYTIGRSPIHGEIDPKIRQALVSRCGSWRNALYQIGLEPVMRIKPFFGSYIDHRSENNQLQHSDNLYDCFYKVLNLSQDNLQRLEQVRLLQEELGRIPTKKDVSRELRLPLQEACGTWTNVLFQLGISPGEYHAAQRKAREKREGAGKKKKI